MKENILPGEAMDTLEDLPPNFFYRVYILLHCSIKMLIEGEIFFLTRIQTGLINYSSKEKGEINN